MVPPPAGTWLEVDPVRMQQVIGNLLHNAAKFTPRGGTIELRVRRGDEGVEMTVTDNGVGIAPDVLPRVFELFSQGDNTLERTQGGLGIGLSLVKGLVEMHGGNVRACSDGPGRGSCFVVELPGSLMRAAPAGIAPAAQVARFASQRILLVEDNLDAAEAMSMLLKGLGHAVTVVNDGSEAVEVARTVQPEVILLDIGLPGINGYELVSRLRQMPETRAARMIAVSGYGQQKDRQRSAEAGFDMHLVKPVDPVDLSNVLAAMT
jgi:CheY-like chemotaxis protein